MTDRPPSSARWSGEGHAAALGIAAALGAPVLALALATASAGSLAGRAIAFAAPWTPDLQVVERLGAAGAEWAVPLWLPGAWLVEMRPRDTRSSPSGALLLPIGDGLAFLGGCAPAPMGQVRAIGAGG